MHRKREKRAAHKIRGNFDAVNIRHVEIMKTFRLRLDYIVGAFDQFRGKSCIQRYYWRILGCHPAVITVYCDVIGRDAYPQNFMRPGESRLDFLRILLQNMRKTLFSTTTIVGQGKFAADFTSFVF